MSNEHLLISTICTWKKLVFLFFSKMIVWILWLEKGELNLFIIRYNDVVFPPPNLATHLDQELLIHSHTHNLM